jgi:hypothetical protein
MSQKEQAIEIIRYAANIQRQSPQSFADANANDIIQGFGNAAIANILEKLGAVGVVADVKPMFSAGGIGFAYRLAPDVISNLTDDQSVINLVDDFLAGGSNETSAAIRRVLRRCQEHSINPIYVDDLLRTLQELRLCFANECYIACLALSGKLLEICLKQTMISNNLSFDEKWIIGKLLNELRQQAPDIYFDQSLGDVANIINKSRIPAVHTLERIPVPSREKTVMVINAVVDTLNRTLLSF